MDFTILRYTQSASMTLTKYADDFYSKSCKVADVYDESTLKDIFIEDVDSSICQSLREYWDSNLEAILTNIAFKAQPLIATQKQSMKPLQTGN